jgi:hypothetical protein
VERLFMTSVLKKNLDRKANTIGGDVVMAQQRKKTF